MAPSPTVCLLLNNGRKADAFEIAQRHAIHSTELSDDGQQVINLLAITGQFRNGLETDHLKLDAAMVRATDAETINIDLADILLHVIGLHSTQRRTDWCALLTSLGDLRRQRALLYTAAYRL